MGVKVTGVTSTEEMLLRLDSTARRRVLRELIARGKELRDLAIKMAPIDHGNMEKAIKMRPEEGAGQARDDLGRFTRTEVEIYIDMEMPIPERPGKVIGDYAYEIHEHLEPMGFMRLGPKSQQKQDGNPGFRVGGGFLRRAADEVDKTIDAELARVLDEFF